MRSDQKIALLLTFMTGMFLGMFLYVTNFAQKYHVDKVSEKSDLSIVGEVYGGCRMAGSCLSFRINEGGQYKYLHAETETEGVLPSELREPIFSELTSYRLASYASPKAIRNDCVSYVDGLDYSYRISYEGETYTLDTCKTTFPGNSDLQLSLLEAIDYMVNPTTTYPTIIEKGPAEWLIDRFQNGG